jgi:hypothetical protein
MVGLGITHVETAIVSRAAKRTPRQSSQHRRVDGPPPGLC